MRDFVTRIGARTKLLRRASEQSANSMPSSAEPIDFSPTTLQPNPPNTALQSSSPGSSVPAHGNAISKLSERGPTTALNLDDLPEPLAQSKTVANQAVPPTVTVQRPTPPTIQDEGNKGGIDSRIIQLNDPARHIPLTPDSLPAATAGSPVTKSLEPEPIVGFEDSSRSGQPPSEEDYFGDAVSTNVSYTMPKKIWVKRPGASATLVQINEGDLVDDVRDMILRKYANSLGRSFDAPDVSLRIAPREETQRTANRTLGPEESILKTLEAYFPGGQTVNEALIIDVPRQRTPRPSPGLIVHGGNIPRYAEDNRPTENGSDYFPPMPVSAAASPGPHPLNFPESRHSHHHSISNQHAISILETGQIPPLPSPRGLSHRPKYARQHTSSPTLIAGAPPSLTTMSSHHQTRQGRPRHDSTLSDQKHVNHIPAAPPIPTPPPVENAPNSFAGRLSGPSTPRVASPRPSKNRKSRKQTNSNEPLPPSGQNQYSSIPGLVDGSVPPINVLIVEDNPINLRLLEAFVKRLKVRWQTAMNGRDAVTKWRGGGFHLVLMDIQLPIMSGLEATKEIRRLERVNGIGVFARSEDEERSSTAVQDKEKGSEAAENGIDAQSDADKLQLEGLLKSPVIIVALTASSLQSDRHEALAAGCNDFLTKPVSFPWFERKVMEWGCMQALIDFDGWRKWKDFAAKEAEKRPDKKDGASGKSGEEKAKRASLKVSTTNAPSAAATTSTT